MSGVWSLPGLSPCLAAYCRSMILSWTQTAAALGDKASAAPRKHTADCGKTTCFTLSTYITPLLATRSDKQQNKQDSCKQFNYSVKIWESCILPKLSIYAFCCWQFFSESTSNWHKFANMACEGKTYYKFQQETTKFLPPKPHLSHFYRKGLWKKKRKPLDLRHKNQTINNQIKICITSK